MGVTKNLFTIPKSQLYYLCVFHYHLSHNFSSRADSQVPIRRVMTVLTVAQQGGKTVVLATGREMLGRMNMWC